MYGLPLLDAVDGGPCLDVGYCANLDNMLSRADLSCSFQSCDGAMHETRDVTSLM